MPSHGPKIGSKPIVLLILISLTSRIGMGVESLSTYYSRLGLEPKANAEEIRSSYLNVRRRFHEAADRGDAQATRILQEAGEAYDYLKKYTKSIQSEGMQPSKRSESAPPQGDRPGPNGSVLRGYNRESYLKLRKDYQELAKSKGETIDTMLSVFNMNRIAHFDIKKAVYDDLTIENAFAKDPNLNRWTAYVERHGYGSAMESRSSYIEKAKINSAISFFRFGVPWSDHSEVLSFAELHPELFRTKDELSYLLHNLIMGASPSETKKIWPAVEKLAAKNNLRIDFLESATAVFGNLLNNTKENSRIPFKFSIQDFNHLEAYLMANPSGDSLEVLRNITREIPSGDYYLGYLKWAERARATAERMTKEHPEVLNDRNFARFCRRTFGMLRSAR